MIAWSDVCTVRLLASIFPVWFQQEGSGEYVSLCLASVKSVIGMEQVARHDEMVYQFLMTLILVAAVGALFLCFTCQQVVQVVGRGCFF